VPGQGRPPSCAAACRRLARLDGVDTEAFVAALEAEATAMAAAAERGLDRAVPPCPGWDVADLVGHMGSIHRFAATAVTSGVIQRPGKPAPPVDPSALVPWLRGGAGALAAALRGADPGAEVWTWTGPAVPAWWARRQALETAVHRVDAQLAHGAADALDAALAVAGMEETFEVWPREYGGTGGPEATVHLHATDVSAEWLVRLGPAGMTATPEHAKGDAALRGSASDLYLWLWNRVPLERLEVFGDVGAARLWTETARF
jgi:uncharacterized protein (TIGR03083 family)